MAFKKGISGNPAGGQISNVDGYNLPQVCRIKSKDTVELVAKIAADESAPLNTRLRAVEMLWDRGYGKATLTIAEVPITKKAPREMSTEELRAEADLLRRNLGLIGSDGRHNLDNVQ